MTTATWATPAPPSTADRTANLYRNLIGVIVAVQAGFLGLFAAVYAYAAILMTGEPFNDLGVALSREMILSDIAGLWFITSLATVAVAFVLAAALPRRWKR